MAETTVSQAEKKKNRFRFPLWQKGVRYGEVDLAFFLIVIALLVIGIIMMFSASYAWAISEGLEGSYYAKEQIKMAGFYPLLIIIFIKRPALRFVPMLSLSFY